TSPFRSPDMRPVAMRPFLPLSLLLIALLLPFANAQAVTVDDLHRATVDVVDKSEKERTKAFRTGLERVLVRVAGSAAVLDRDGVDRLLESPDEFVQQYRYESIEDEEDDGDGSGNGDSADSDGDGDDKPKYRLAISFASGRIERHLEDLEIVVWGDERPEVLVWLAVEDGGDRRILDTDADSEAYEALMDEARRRALPVLLPLMDTSDRQKVDFVDISGGFFDTVEEASERYRSDILLVGHVRRAGGEWRTDWTLIGAGERRGWDGTDDGLGAAVATGVGGATDRLATMLAGKGGERTRLRARIEGVKSLDDYARVTEYIGGLVRIRSSALREVLPEELVFDLEVRGELGEFERAVALGDVLEKVERREPDDEADNGDDAESDTVDDETVAGDGGEDDAPRTQVVFRLTD
ncbi:MAG: DUF2066 domain-containing protein, partial [Halofilum sp. (in: g-proteobacteria)]